MYFRTKRLLNATAVTAAVCFTALPANAERATVNLPFEVHWGGVVLEPGEHTIFVTPAVSWPQRISLDEKRGTAWVLALAEGTEVESDTSYLKLVSVAETYFVREYFSGSTGKRFTFSVSDKTGHERGSKSYQIKYVPLEKQKQ